METDVKTASPPAYAEAVGDVADETLPPVILVLDGQSIHAEPDPTVHLYEVNRGIAHLGPATKIVEFARVERRAGSATQRSRHIYNLHHPEPHPLLHISSSSHAEYFIKAVASPARRLGHLGLKKARGLSEHWTALPVDMKGWTELDWPPFVAGAAPVFEAHHRHGTWKWTGADSHEVAMEYDSDQEYRLLVTASLQRSTLDALVALWCCRVWQQSVIQQRSHAVPTNSISHVPPVGWKKFR